jgi:phosphoacetylglucosamine mutase
MEAQLLPEILQPEPSDDEVLRLVEKYPHENDSKVDYGTAGFRYDAKVLPAVMVRVGLAATLRSLQQQAPIGVMVTASHNDESYNGVKMADQHGGMMGSDGESLAVELANERDVNALMIKVKELREKHSTSSFVPTVHIGRDTREHSPALCSLVIKTARALGSRIVDHRVVTTPQLHHAVLHCNRQYLPVLIPPRPNIIGYFELLSQSYNALLETKPAGDIDRSQPLVVDAACGVGYAHLQTLNSKIQALNPTHRPFLAINAPGSGPLNHNCGSEHVQKALQPPVFYDQQENISKEYCASVDGDADRIVFFFVRDDNSLCLLDGDKISCLLSGFLQAEWTAVQKEVPDLPELRLGVVQTAYANGASTNYLKKVLDGEEKVAIAKTGVKHVHHAAEEKFDVGVYFEANGHGTILFGANFYKCISLADAALRGRTSRGATGLQRLSVLPALVNQAVGDALSDLLLVDAILQIQGWTLSDWDAIYTDLPSRQCKVLVKDRTKIQTNDNETKCLAPKEVQDELEAAMQELGGRAFVRPSGTEDVVRVYAEANTRELADQLATRAADIVHRLCDGIAKPPVFPQSRI